MSLSIHTIKQLPEPDGGWSVGYWLQYSEHSADAPGWSTGFTWQEICQFKDVEDALRRVSILNGGGNLP